MGDYSILDVHTVLSSPVTLKDISYNCPVCDYEIEIDMILEDSCFIECDNCQHRIKLKIKKIE